MTNVNSTALQTGKSRTSIRKLSKQYESYSPVVFIDCGYDVKNKMSLGKNITLDSSFQNIQDALEAARAAFIVTNGAIGYTAKVIV